MLALVPTQLAGFFYHPKLVAVVHLVTIGWITGSILGALHLVLPMAMRTPLPVHRLDRWAFWSFVVGELGIVSHFWIGAPRGMVWSATLVIAAIAWVAWRVLGALRRAPIPVEHRLPFVFAFANMLAAGVLGLLIGIDKSSDVLTGFVLDHVAAHAHLAALGWATLMVMGAGYRLLPMVLPTAMPRGAGPLMATLMTQLGVLGIAVTLWFGSRLAVIAMLVFMAGCGAFIRQVRWMLAHPKPPPKALRRPDLGRWHLASAFVYLVIATGVGSVVVAWPASSQRSALLTGYGVALFVGFLSQMVVGISVRLLPLYTWMRDFSAGGFEQVPLSPHRRVVRPAHHLTFWSWSLAVPLLGVGLAVGEASLTRLGGTLLAIATVSSLAQIGYQLRFEGRIDT